MGRRENYFYMLYYKWYTNKLHNGEEELWKFVAAMSQCIFGTSFVYLNPEYNLMLWYIEEPWFWKHKLAWVFRWILYRFNRETYTYFSMSYLTPCWNIVFTQHNAYHILYICYIRGGVSCEGFCCYIRERNYGKRQKCFWD